MEILNRGRGAGKSHALALWQLEDPVNRRIVTNEYTLEQYFQLGVSTKHAYTYKQAADGRLRGFYGAVGFDDFDGYIKNVITNQLHVDVFRSDVSTILVTNFLESELLPGPKELPVDPDYAAKVKEYVKKNWTDETWKAWLGGTPASALLGVVTPEEDPVEPAPVVKRLDELVLGDIIQGKGRVVSIRFASNPDRIIVDVLDPEFGFKGLLDAPADTVVTLAEK